MNDVEDRITYEQYNEIFKKDSEGCFVNLIIPSKGDIPEINLIGKYPNDFTIEEIIRIRKYADKMYKKVDKNTIN